MTTPNNDVVITRTFDAPRELVWKAWTEPEHYQRWWGPKDFSAPAPQIDLRVGGKYLSCMQAPDGQKFWSTGSYLEVTPIERLVYTDSFGDEQGNVVSAAHYNMEDDFPLETIVTVELEELGGKTRMTLTHAGLPEGQHRAMTMHGWSQSFDKLNKALFLSSDERVKQIAEPGKQEITMLRLLNAPRELVYQVITDPNSIPEWWGPANLTTIVEQMDVRKGGVWRYIQRDDNGEYIFNGVYHQVAPYETISTFEWETMPGHVILETVTLEDHDGKTLMINQSVFQSVADRDGMLMSGSESGARESLDRLEALLAKAKQTS